MEVIKSRFGYFDNTGSVPAYDPGTNINCMVCEKPLEKPMKTMSCMILEENETNTVERCYFYRLHAECATEENQEQIERLIIK